MGIVFRQAIKTTAVIFAGAVLGALINYIYTKVFPQNLVGVSRNLLNQGAVLYIFLLMGTISLVHTFAQQYSEEDARRPVLITFSMLVPVAATLVFCIPYFLLKDFIVGRYQGFDRQYIIEFYNWLPLLGLLWSFMALLEYYLISRMKVAIATFMREIVLRIGNIGLIGLFFAGLIDFHQFVVGSVVIHLLPVSILYYLATKTKGFSVSFNWKIFSKAEIGRIVHYTWYHLLLTVSLNLTGMLDVLLLGPLSPNGLKDVAVYNLALFLISILTIPYRALTNAAFPKLNQAFVQQDPDLGSLFVRSAINLQIVSVAMWLIIMCNLHNAVAILPGAYAAIAPCVMILAIGRMADMSTGLNTEMISISNHYKFTFWLSLALLVCIAVLDRIFIPVYGLYGAAWVSTGTLVVFNLIKAGFLYQKMRLLPFTRHTAVIFASGAVIFGINYLIPAVKNPFADTFIRCAILMTGFGLLMLAFRPSPDLSSYLQQIRRNKRFL